VSPFELVGVVPTVRGLSTWNQKSIPFPEVLNTSKKPLCREQKGFEKVTYTIREYEELINFR
jgi:hypothetical protein